MRLSISAQGFPNSSNILLDAYPEPELPTSLFRPTEGELRLSTQVADHGHLRYPRSSSGAWVRPPTWRSPSLDRTPTLPPRGPLPPTPTSATQSHHHYRRHHRSRHQHQEGDHHPSRISTATSISAGSATTASSGRSIYSRRTPKTSTSSATIRSTRVPSGTDLSPPPSGGKHRRLTTEEKLSEIDAFLSPGPGNNGGREGDEMNDMF